MGASSPLATGFARGAKQPEVLLQAAVSAARDKLGGQTVTAALFLFSPPLASVTPTMLQAQMRQLRCLQVAAATFPGVFTDAGQALGESACAVLLLASPLNIRVRNPEEHSHCLSWGRLDLVQKDWLHQQARVGSLSSRNGRFWLQATPQNALDIYFQGLTPTRSLWSAGMRPLSAALSVHRQEGSLLLELERYMALPLLAQNIPVSIRKDAQLPLERLLIAELAHDALPDSPPELLHIRATELNRSGLWLERPLAENSRAFLTLRDPTIAERDTRIVLDEIHHQESEIALAWISSSIGRDATFFGTEDRDLQMWREQFPNVPMIGAYGMGELLPIQERSHFMRYSKIFTTFT